jgi:hypothetical protein
VPVRLRSRYGIVLITLSAALATGPLVGGQADGPDYVALKSQMKVLSAVIDESMAQTFSPPFGVLEKTKGTYLPGFGVVFALEVNLYPVPLQDLLATRPPAKSQLDRELRVKKERINTIRESVTRLLAEHAESLHEVKPDDQIAVVVHIFLVQSGGEELPSQVVVQVRKFALEQYWDKKLTYEQFLKQVRIVVF